MELLFHPYFQQNPSRPSMKAFMTANEAVGPV
jgi:hypothetical protein